MKAGADGRMADAEGGIGATARRRSETAGSPRSASTTLVAPIDAGWRAAYREAGRALIGVVQPRADRPRKSSMAPAQQAYDQIPLDPDMSRRLPGEGYRRGRIIGLLAGAAAERLVLGDVAGPDHDAERAKAMAREQLLVAADHALPDTTRLLPSLDGELSQGHDDEPAQPASELLERELQRVMRECDEHALGVLREHRAALDRLAIRLHRRETLDEDSIRDELDRARTEATGDELERSRSSGPRRAPGARTRPRRTLFPAPFAVSGAARLNKASVRWLPVRREARSSPLVRAHPQPAPGGAAPGPTVAAVADASGAPRRSGRHRSERVLSGFGLARYWALGTLWLVVTVSFWTWWLRHQAGSTTALYWLQTLLLFYQTTLLPTVYWGFVGRMRRPVEMAPPDRLKVALVTLCVPKHESMSVIRQQVDALTAVTYPHDSWILDEGNSDQVRALAEQRGVRYFSRRGVGLWNQAEPPFQRSTKAGNVNAWLDHAASLGLHYDVFVQFDIDHLPRADYLDRTLGYFRDPKIGWVQAPSVVGNLDSWAARGLAEQDLVFHGPLQMGFYGTSRTPFIIGSHTTYRTAAVRDIGGFQPTRAEDHLDTVVLAASGYEGAYVPDRIAVGEGPDGLATYLRQQFAWAYSMIQIFFHHTPRLIRRYSLRQALQFLFCQSWYTMWSMSLAVLWLLPTVALLIHEPIANVSLVQFLVYFAPVALTSSLMWCETRPWFQPTGVKLSWRGIILSIARWPVVLWALVNVLLRVKRPYMITPKGVEGQRPNGALLYGPGLAMGVIPLAAAWLFYATGDGGSMRGYYGLALVNGALGLLLVAVTVGLEVREIAANRGFAEALRSRWLVIIWTLSLLGALVVSTVALWGAMTQALA